MSSTHTYTDRMAMLWSMSPWAGLKRHRILDACRSSLMSNLPHQRTFILINRAFRKGVLHHQAAVTTAHCSVFPPFVQILHLRSKGKMMSSLFCFFPHCCLYMHFACVTSSSGLHDYQLDCKLLQCLYITGG